MRDYRQTLRYVTLRRVAKEGWSAKGLLLPLWHAYEGGETDDARRDTLAAAVGTKGTVLSAINSGARNLGWDLGPRLAKELGVSLLELGAPLDAADEVGQTLLTRLESLAADLAESVRAQAKANDRLKRLEARVRKLEARPSPAEGQSTGQAK